LSRNQARAAHYFDQERAKDERKSISNFVKVWTQNKTEDRMAWAQALNTIVCKGKNSTGSLIWLAFPQELVTRLAELTGGRNVRLHKPKLVEGWIRKDEIGRAFLVEAVNGGLIETCLFTYRDGKVILDDTPPAEEPKDASAVANIPSTQTKTTPPDDGLGHDILEETEGPVEYEAGGLEGDVPF